MHERELREKVQYSTWVRNGLITTTPGDIIDYSYIYKTIITDVKKYAIKEIAFDRWGSNDIVPRLTDEIGNIFLDFGQGFRSMSPASRDFERKVMMGDLATNGNPVMDWMISCTELATDAAGNVKPIKPDRIKTGKHIDGVVASIMAQSRAIAATETKSVYESRGVLLL
jgi:phage terminase large subunit-like protein